MPSNDNFVVCKIKAKIAFGVDGIAQENTRMGSKLKFMFVIGC